jgi:hypothetical protein
MADSKSDTSTGYITWEGSSPSNKDMIKYGESIKYYGAEGSAKASHESFLDIETNRSVRPAYNRGDYDAFRYGESIPSKKKLAIKKCMDAYKHNGIVHNVIDLMGDFGSQGISIVHEDKSVEKFYKEWFRRVDGKERSERFLNTLYRTGNVFVYTSDAKVTPKVVKYIKSRAKNSDIILKVPEANKTFIPWRYNFLNPLTMELKEGDYRMFVARNQFTQRTPSVFLDMFKTGDSDKTLLNTLPIDVQKQIKEGSKHITLDQSKLSTFYYKKDDWDDWADPMIYAILDNINILDKMRLADLSALDGAISNIRLWTLGDFEHKILPTKEGVQKLRNILASNVGGGVLDLVWGPELKFTESNSEVYKFLGSEKYVSVLNAIYAGMGVPPTLTGMAGNGGGFTNNFISLKTLVERLQYGRDRLTTFWNNELDKVRRSMGFRKSAFITFDQMNLSDDASEKALLIELLDRNVISEETVRERFKEITKVETVRIGREDKMRDDDKMPPKAGPFHNPGFDQEVEKMEKQQEFDSQEHDKDIDVKKIDIKNRPKPTGPGGPAKKPVKKNGRPKNKQDTRPRKKRTETPKSKPGLASIIITASKAFDFVSNSITSAYLGSRKVDDMRKLTKAQIAELESMKLDAFTNLDIYEEITMGDIKDSLLSGDNTPESILGVLKEEGINLNNMSVYEYKRAVVATVVEQQYME